MTKDILIIENEHIQGGIKIDASEESFIVRNCLFTDIPAGGAIQIKNLTTSSLLLLIERISQGNSARWKWYQVLRSILIWLRLENGNTVTIRNCTVVGNRTV